MPGVVAEDPATDERTQVLSKRRANLSENVVEHSEVLPTRHPYRYLALKRRLEIVPIEQFQAVLVEHPVEPLRCSKPHVLESALLIGRQ